MFDMFTFLLAGMLSLFGWALLLVMLFFQVVVGGAYESERDRRGKLKPAA